MGIKIGDHNKIKNSVIGDNNVNPNKKDKLSLRKIGGLILGVIGGLSGIAGIVTFIIVYCI